jgi:hypothetical protein
MKQASEWVRRFRLLARGLGIAAVTLTLAAPAFAQANSPWENAVNVLQQAFTSTIARGLSLVAIVVSGLTFAFAPLKPTSPTRSMWSSTWSAGRDGALSPKCSKSTATTRMLISSTTVQFFRRRNPSRDRP